MIKLVRDDELVIFFPVFFQQQAQKKRTTEKIKRKNYEISTLKTELSDKDRDLQESRRRVVTLETTIVSQCLIYDVKFWSGTIQNVINL